MKTDSSLKKKNYNSQLGYIILRFVLLIVFGLTAGYLINKSAKADGNTEFNYFLIVSITCGVISIILFIIRFIKLQKKYHNK